MRGFDPGLYKAIAEESGFAGEELATYMEALDKEAGPTAYAFHCRICGAWGGYSDIH